LPWLHPHVTLINTITSSTPSSTPPAATLLCRGYNTITSSTPPSTPPPPRHPHHHLVTDGGAFGLVKLAPKGLRSVLQAPRVCLFMWLTLQESAFGFHNRPYGAFGYAVNDPSRAFGFALDCHKGAFGSGLTAV
ncbi:hypothetical protein Tco_0188046, partial [Tanacetum coccineum]